MVTSWHAHVWARLIALLPEADRAPFEDIPRQIKEGFTLGICLLVGKTFSPPNRLADNDPLNAVIHKYILKQLALGRLDGPYLPAHFKAEVGPYRTAPLNVAPKGTTLPGEPLKWRIVENPAFPYEQMVDATCSINSEIDASEFPCSWIKLSTCQELFRDLPPHAVVLGTDMADGFHHIPLASHARKHFCLSHRSLVFTRKCAQFGVTTTPGVFGNTMDATSAILRLLVPDIHTLNQVDDLLIVLLDLSTLDTAIYDILDDLGWIRNDKGWSRAHLFVFLGVEWDLDALTMTVPDRKRQKYLLRVKTALHYARCKIAVDLTFVESLIGSLMYVCYVIPRWKTDIFSLFAFRRKFSSSTPNKRYSKKHHMDTHTTLVRCLELWHEHLSQEIITSSFAIPRKVFEWDITSDACDLGLGVTATPYDSEFGYSFYAPLPAGWKNQDGLHIGPAEGWGAELQLNAATALGEKDCTLELWCDNDGFTMSWPKHLSRNAAQNNSIARMTAKADPLNIHIVILCINTKDNPSDCISRGKVDDYLYKPFPFPLVPFLPRQAAADAAAAAAAKAAESSLPSVCLPFPLPQRPLKRPADAATLLQPPPPPACDALWDLFRAGSISAPVVQLPVPPSFILSRPAPRPAPAQPLSTPRLPPTLPPLTPVQRLLLAPLPASSSSLSSGGKNLTQEQFADAILSTCENMGNVTLDADAELQTELQQLFLDPSFAACYKYADAPTNVSHDPSLDLTGDLLTGQLLYRSILKSGVEAHAGCVLRYIGFCEEDSVPATEIFSAKPDVVFAFLASMGGSLRAATIRAYVNSIRFWHTIHGVNFEMNEEHFQVLKQGLTQVQPAAKDTRPPVHTADLVALKDGLNVDVLDPNNALEQPEADCIWAAATGAFHGMARSCDVTVKCQGIWGPSVDLAADAVEFFEDSDVAPAHVTLSLPFDKVKHREGSVRYLVRQSSDPRLDPVRARATHFASNRLEGQTAFAFSYRATRDSKSVKAGELLTFTVSHFTKTVNKYLLAAGRCRIWGHSFRIGGATMYLLAGKDVDSIHNIGRWSSNAFDCYWRDIKTITANNLADAEYLTIEADEAVSFATLLGLDSAPTAPCPKPKPKPLSKPKSRAPTRIAKKKK
ncbi:hypothetical protein P7C70_g4055, partial [Phenoliferia sp. Uapishka_3]